MASAGTDELSMRMSRFNDVVQEHKRMLPPIAGYENMPLVSLEEAIRPLIEHVPQVEKYASDAKKKCQKTSEDGLSDDEVASIRLYTMEGEQKDQCFYNVLNDKLRSEDRSKLKPWFRYLKLFLNALLKIESSPVKLFRGVNKNISGNYEIGETFIWWGFSSCTLKKEVAEQFSGKSGPRTMFEIHSISGKAIQKYSDIPTEAEVLLIAATEFRVEQKIDQGDGLIIVQLKEIESKFCHISKNVVTLPKVSSSAPTKPFIDIPITTEPVTIHAQKVQNEGQRNPEIRQHINRVQYGSKVTIERQQLNQEDTKDLVENIIMSKKCPQLAILDSRLTTKSIEELAKGVSASTTIHEIDLTGCHLSSDDISNFVAEISVAGRHEVVHCQCCGFKRTTMVEGAPIKILKLSKNQIDDNGIKHIAVLLRNRLTLTVLYLNGNQIGDEGVKQLAKILTNPLVKLEQLYLHDNKRITDRSVNDLRTIIKQSFTLKSLWLIGCSFSDTSREDLIEEAKLRKEKFYLNIENFNK